ncbi:zinc-binding alcohol dehydrogenase family protein [Paenibacillus sp. YYML68]|uniref:zinc-binding alcohol dehydrogenase family protein n=1 Tax=Paenibacillus sp. YYML68 TaxID=2909250 RepID=UPI00248F6E33|nr:zinc-binding alcohol dehydrogenase family protein [Paenibacillus sp. YYML68]
MKTIICEQVERFVMTEQEEPELTEGCAVVQIRRIGICGTDLHAYKGNQPFFTYPKVLGHELSGTIVRVAGESEWKAGDLVSIIPYMHCGKCLACREGKTNCCTSMQVLGVHMDGGMRERIAVPLSHLVRADGLTLDEAALLEPLSIGAHAVRRAQVKEGQRALVIGAGPIGLGVMAFARLAGAEVIAMDVNEERLDFCRRWAGVKQTVHALQEPLAALRELTEGELPQVVFDATGNGRSMTAAFDYAAHGGTLVYVGLVKGDITFHDPEFHKRELTLMGSRNATADDFGHVLEAVRSGAVQVGPLITHRAAFTQMIDEFEQWLLPEQRVIKAIVEL